MGLSRTVSEINGDLVENRTNFPTPLYFAPLLKGFPWNWVSAPGDKKTRMMVLPGRQRSLTIYSAVWIECTNVTDGRTDGRTDRRTDTGPQQRPHLRIASRGNKIEQI